MRRKGKYGQDLEKMRFPISASETLGVAGALSLAYTIAREFGIGGILAGTVCLSLFVAVMTLWSIARVYAYEADRFKIFSSRSWKGALVHLENAQVSIYATHFSNSIPSEAYLAVMLEKLREGVGIARVIRSTAASEERNRQWLAKFRGIAGYREIQTRHGYLPMDFMVIDARKVLIFMPVHSEAQYFDQGILFDNSSIAALFRAAFERLEKVYGAEGNLTDEGERLQPSAE